MTHVMDCQGNIDSHDLTRSIGVGDCRIVIHKETVVAIKIHAHISAPLDLSAYAGASKITYVYIVVQSSRVILTAKETLLKGM